MKTQARSATILPNFVGMVFQVHNGKNYIDVEIKEEMVGHKLGEFAAYGIRHKHYFIELILNQNTEALLVQAE